MADSGEKRTMAQVKEEGIEGKKRKKMAKKEKTLTKREHFDYYDINPRRKVLHEGVQHPARRRRPEGERTPFLFWSIVHQNSFAARWRAAKR